MEDLRKRNPERKTWGKRGAELSRASAPAVVRLLKRLEEYEPSPMFKARVSFYAMLPRVSLAILSKTRRMKERMAQRNATTPRLRRITPFPNRTVAYAAASVALLLAVFVILYAVGIGTGPGDSLYFVRKIRDRFDLTLSRSTLERIQKEIALAEEKLNRISELSAPSKDQSDVGKVRAAVDDYRENAKSLNLTLSDKPIEASAEKQRSLALKLKSVKLKEAKVLNSLISRNPESVFTPGSGAVVALKGAYSQESERDILGFKAVAGKNGEISISLEALKTEDETMKFDLTVEADGRKLVFPLSESAKETEAEKTFDEGKSLQSEFSLEFAPPVKAMRKDEKSTFMLTLKKNGAPVALHKVLVEDNSSSCLVNNGTRCLVATDTEGRAEFVLTKTDVSRSSRLRFNVQGKLTNGEWVDLGERLLIGGIEGPSSVPAGSKILTRTYSNGNGVRLVELENAYIKVCASSRTPGLIAESILRKKDGQSLGSLSDPLVTRSASGNLAVPVRNLNGPYLVFAEKEAAAYETSYEIPSEEGWVKRRFRVIVPEEGELALVFARTENYDGTWISPQEGVALEAANLFGGNGKKLTLSGQEYSCSQAAGNLPEFVRFLLSEPYALIENESSFGVFSVPYTSAPFVKDWVITASGIGFRLEESSISKESTPGFSAVFGFIEKPRPTGILEDYLLEASDPIYFHTVSKAYEADFLVNIEQVKIKGAEGEKEALMIRIFKTYRK